MTDNCSQHPKSLFQYFGTSLDSAGHYFWDLEGNYLGRSRTGFNDCPFNPEALPYKQRGQPYKNGLVQFYLFCGFSILAIEGSCKDTRPGSKSIFFIKEDLTKEEFIEKIKSVPIFMKILTKMPFTVNL